MGQVFVYFRKSIKFRMSLRVRFWLLKKSQQKTPFFDLTASLREGLKNKKRIVEISTKGLTHPPTPS